MLFSQAAYSIRPVKAAFCFRELVSILLQSATTHA